jgi:hypothetical protein
MTNNNNDAAEPIEMQEWIPARYGRTSIRHFVKLAELIDDELTKL